MKIHHLREVKRSHIDDDRWNSLVQQYGHGQPYSATWYLDALGKWKGLVLGDYEMIFPLIYHQKYLYQKRLYQPFLSQCFGPTGDKSLSDNLAVFLDYITQHWPNSHFYFPIVQTASTPAGMEVTQRVNQVITLDRKADTVRAQYTRTRRSQVRQHRPLVNIVVDKEIERFLDAYQQAEYPTTKPILKQMDLFKRLLNACHKQESLEIITVNDLDGNLLNTAAFVVTDTRVINLIGASSAQGRQARANVVKIDYMLTRHCEDKRIFDFFGSNIQGVNSFNKQFGAVEIPYWMVKV